MFSCVEWIATIEYIRFGLMGSYACILKSVVVERFLALYNLSTYETHSYKWFTFVCITAQIGVGTAAFLLIYYSRFYNIKFINLLCN